MSDEHTPSVPKVVSDFNRYKAIYDKLDVPVDESLLWEKVILMGDRKEYSQALYDSYKETYRHFHKLLHDLENKIMMCELDRMICVREMQTEDFITGEEMETLNNHAIELVGDTLRDIRSAVHRGE